MQSIWKYVNKSSIKTQTSQSNYLNKYWKKVSYNMEDKIWLLTKNICSDQLFKKLNHKIIGLFEIIRKKSILLEL